MMLRQSKKIIGASVIFAVAAAPSLQAQEVDVRAGQTAVQVDGSGVDVDANSGRTATRYTSQMDRQIADWLLVDQRSIVELAQFGSKRATSPEVRELAEAIIRDHQAMIEKLAVVDSPAVPLTRRRVDAALATAGEERARERQLDAAEDRLDERGEANREAARDARRDRDGVRRPLENLADRVEDGLERVTDRAEQAFDNAGDAVDRELRGDRDRNVRRFANSPWVGIHGDIASKLNQAARDDLAQRQGYEFDAALVGMFVASHLQQQATLEVLSTRASGELKQDLSNALVTVEHHRQQAEQVMQSIKR